MVSLVRTVWYLHSLWRWWGIFLVVCLGTGCTSQLPTIAYERRLHTWHQSPVTVTTSASEAVRAELFAPLDRATLVRLVLTHNPSIAAAQQAWRAALERYPQVTALDDPVLSYALAPRTLGKEAAANVGQIVQFSQRLPFPGKRPLQGHMALAEADALQEDYETVRRNLALLASQLYDDYYVVERAIAINAQHQAILQDFQRAAEAQYIVGRATQQDAIQAETEIAQLRHQELSARTNRRVIIAQLNGLLHREPQASLPAPPTQFPLPPLLSTTSQTLMEMALRQRPELHAIQARQEASDAAVHLAARQYYPDFTVMGTYNSLWEAPERRVTLGAAVNLPVQRARRQAAVAEAQARQERTTQEYHRLVDTVRVEVEQAYQRLLEAHQAARLYQDHLLPAAHDRIVAAQAAFESGRSMFLTLIEAEKNQRTVTLRYHEILAELYRRQAQLERAIGLVPGLSMLGETS